MKSNNFLRNEQALTKRVALFNPRRDGGAKYLWRDS